MLISKRNRRGLFWLLILMLVVAISPRVVGAFYSIDSPLISHEKMIEVHKQFVQEKREKKAKSRQYKKNTRYSVLKRKSDPNTFTKSDWMDVGLSDKQSDIVLKFSSRGLRSNEDLAKIFVFPEELFELIKDSLFYPEIQYSGYTQQDKTDNDQYTANKKEIIVDINTATQEELESIPGIGPFFSNKIIEHRLSLGGYLNKQQLTEIWKFDQEKLNSIDDFIVVGHSHVLKMNINTVTKEQLAAHPYFSYKVANSIVKMREMKDGYTNLTEIKESKLIDRELYNKITPYLKLK